MSSFRMNHSCHVSTEARKMSEITTAGNPDDVRTGCASKKARDFYSFFRSANNNEFRNNLILIASNRDLDKQDLALLVLMLTNIPQPNILRVTRQTPACTQALQRMLETVRENELAHGMQPWQQDVEEIERIIYGPPLSPDIP